jgi:hypothetical protein
MFRALAAVAVLAFAPALPAYSVLTHEAIIDSAWEQNIKPLLLKRFPDATPEDLRDAHAYAYAGCIIQDMGYYPFGSRLFSDLVHYVRSGDFVVTLIRDSQNLSEYAFALGALAHYAADTQGHSIAVNPAVAIEFPKLREKYGRAVTYEDDPAAHMKVEFGFDVTQVARGHYAPQSYHDFIGFKVSKPVLERAFHDTYGLELEGIFRVEDLAIGTYRRTVSKIIPEMTKVAWSLNKHEMVKGQPGLTRRRFVYNISRASYHKEWDRTYERPGIGARILAFFFRILPKVGPLRSVRFTPPTSQTVTLFEDSFNRTMTEYRGLLQQVGQSRLALENRDFDTGAPTRPGEYKLADDTYAKLAVMLAAKDPPDLDLKVVDNVLGFFRNSDAPLAAKEDPKLWTATQAALGKLRALPAVPKNPAAPEVGLGPN